MARRSVIALIVPLILAPRADAQRWNDAETLTLVERATARRALQLADTGLVDYRARAHGYLSFLAQVGAGFPEPPKIVKADELALDVFWKAPNMSKQLILGRRDTLLLPTDIQYHRDHLGIVQNNFPAIIRLGDGDEVRDVPHPLSAGGTAVYDFDIADSLELRLGPRSISVYEVRVRPKDDRAARLVGAIYIERESADLVRMAFGFTRSALKDPALEDLSIVLENGLIEGRFWLPRRQEIEIRRTGTWLDYPVRTIIRGRWEICCYAVNVGLAADLFRGPEIEVSALPRSSAEPLFEGNILDGLPPAEDPVTEAEVRRVQAEMRELVRGQALARTPRPALAGTRVSDFVRFNRVEGFALGAGIGQRVGAGFAVAARARHGFSDDRWKGAVDVFREWPGGSMLRLTWRDDHADAGAVEETSLTRNSIAAQEFGSDYTQPYGVRGVELAAVLRTARGRFGVELRREHHDPLGVNATSATGRFEAVVAARPALFRTAALRWEHAATYSRARGRIVASLGAVDAVSSAGGRYGRASVRVRVDPARAPSGLALEMFGAGVGSKDPAPQHHVLLGGPVSGPGYEFHQFVATSGGFARAEWRTAIPFPSLRLGRFGRTPTTATLAPYAHVVVVEGGQVPAGGYPAVGVALIPFFDLLRVDVARGLRNGRWTLGIDVTRDLWPVL